MGAAVLNAVTSQPMTGRREFRSATARLIVPELEDIELIARTRQINDLNSSNPRKGHATALMHQICDEADKNGFLLILEARPFADGITQEQLEKFYQKFGFWAIEQEGPRLMARMPGGTPTDISH
jgi:hypothetical protein